MHANGQCKGRFQLSLRGGILLLCLTGLVGCEQKPAGQETTQVAQKTPEEQFERFFEVLEQKMLNNSGRSYAAAQASGSNAVTTSWKTTVTSEMKPAEEGKPRQASVTIARDSEVTVLVPKQENSKAAGPNRGDDELSQVAKEFVPELVEAKGGTTDNASTPSIQTLPERDVQTYQFEYQEGRWVLTSEIDELAQPFTSLAIEYALSRQD